MGCSTSAFDNEKHSPQFQKDLIQYQAMQLSEKEVRKLYNEFRKVDMDNSGSIALPELLAHLDLPVTPFTQKVFSIFDDDGSGEVDFKEFVMTLWNYCTLTAATLEMFAFDMYDSDGSGEISPNEVTQMLTDLFGKHEVKTNQHAKAMAAELHDHARNFRDPFTIDTFRTFVKSHQAMLFPAFQMQLALQRKFLGTAFWESNANRRMEICNGKYISVGTFIAEHAQAESAAAMQPLKFARIGEDPSAAPVVAAGGRAVRRKSMALNNQRKDSSNGFGNLTTSARIRLNAAASGVQGFFASSGKHNKRTNSSPSKVYVASAKAPNMGSGTNTPSQSNAVLHLSRENSVDIYATSGAISPPLPAHAQVRRRSHVESPFVSPQISPRGHHSNVNVHHALSSGLNSKIQSNNSSTANLRASLSPATSNLHISHNNSNQHLSQAGSQNNLANNVHNKSAGNMRRASKEPKEFEDAINQIFSNMGADSPEKGHGQANGHARPRKNSKENSNLIPLSNMNNSSPDKGSAVGHVKLPRKNSKENSSLIPLYPIADEHEKKPRRRTSIALNDANNIIGGGAGAMGGAHLQIDMHELKHSPGKQKNRRKSFG